MPRPRLAPLLGLLAAAAAGRGAASTSQADIAVLERRANASASLLVRNRAASAVRLANCGESHTVEAGGNVSLALAGLTGFWLVPRGVQWDCYNGTFDLFYAAVNFTGPELVASVGHGPGPGGAGAPQGADLAEAAGGAGAAGAGAPSGGQPPAGAGIAGVELTAGAAAAPGRGVRCAAGSCGPGQQVAALPEGFGLTILGPSQVGAQAPLLSRERWGGRDGWGGGGWGGGGWRGGYGGDGWHDGWGRHGWGGGGCAWCR